jgi:hypothetical protein
VWPRASQSLGPSWSRGTGEKGGGASAPSINMATVTLYEYDGETRTESSVAVNWRQVGDPVKFEQHECSFDEALSEAFFETQILTWGTAQRVSKRIKAYEAESDDRPLYRAEVKE